jgi:hypothetical protein
VGRAGGGFSVGDAYEICFEKIGVTVDKLNEWFLALCTFLVGGVAFIVKRLFGRIDRLEERTDSLERSLLTREDLDSSLEPLQATNQLILSHLLKHRETEREPDKTKEH